MDFIHEHPFLASASAVVAILIIGATGVFVLVWRTVGYMTGARVPSHTLTPDAYGLSYSEFSCETADGITIKGWYVPCEDARATVIILNGDRGERDGLLGHARLLYDAGCSVIMFDYRHHGESGDDAITYGAREVLDVRAVYDYARANGLVEGKLVVFGLSMGAATAALAGPDLDGADGFILNSGYARFGDAMKDHIRRMLLPARLFYPIARVAFRVQSGGADPNDINPVETVGDIDVPVLIIQGGRDRIIDKRHGDTMYEAANEPKSYAYFPEADHIVVWDELDDIKNEGYKEAITSFMDSVCKKDGGE